MTQQERVKIVNLISAAIKENGPQELKHLPNVLTAGGIPKPVYSPIKKTLENQFPEFFVYGTSGYEAVDYFDSALSKFYRLLTGRIQYKLPVTQVSVLAVAELAREAGLNDRLYATDDAVRKLLRVYPAYQVPEHSAAVLVTSSTEVDFIQAVAFLNWKQIFTKLSEIAASGVESMEQVREVLAFRFAKALLDGDGLLLDGLEGAAPRAALCTGFKTAKGEDIYCLLQPNAKETGRQPWKLLGVTYPNEQDEDGLGVWLSQTFFSHTGLNYQSVRTQIDALEEQRVKLLPMVSTLLDTIRDGVCPENVSEALAQYESGWSALNKSLEQAPSLEDCTGKPLAEIQQLLNEDNAVANIAQGAVALFENIFDSVQKLLARIKRVEPVDDLARVRKLFTATNVSDDVQTFREILRPYVCLLQVLRSTDRMEVQDNIITVADHFSQDRLDVTFFLLGQYSENYAFLNDLDQIEDLLKDCLRAADRVGKTVSQPIAAEDLAEAVLSGDDSLPMRWISLYGDLMPEDPELKAVLLSSGEALPGRQTPASAAGRLLDFCGNKDRLAERYLLLGLLTDSTASATRLLGLYRDNKDEERFLTLWNSKYRGSGFTVPDACYWLSILCSKDSVCWDEIEDFVGRFPNVKQSNEYKATITAQLARQTGHSAAYTRWLSMTEPQLNAVEAAVVANDTDALYLLLADSEKMLALGYEADETARIQQALGDGLPGGTDAYGKAVRLYGVQKNKNAAVECLLWQASLTQSVLRMLFDIYQEAGDHSSLSWLTQKFPVPLDTFARSAAYAEALAKTEQTDTLAALLSQHPELWHKAGLLKELKGAPWEEIYRRESENPILERSGFAQALVEDDTAAMEALLADTEKMASWGYSKEQISALKEKLLQEDAPSGTDRVSVVKRFGYYQGNFRRELEAYLYSQLDAQTDWAIQHLYKLAYSEDRFADAAAYFTARPRLACNTPNICTYMWCLLHLGESERLFRHAQQNPECLRTDSALVKAILELANRENMAEFSEAIRRMIDLLPKNDFERAVLTGHYADMQKYVSDPDLLTAQGYAPESIARFKERLTRPFPSGTNGYPLAARMGLFFGNERAVPFLLDALEDSRAAKLLIDIYYSTHQWDEVCELYRDQLPNGIWNTTNEQRYYEALSRASGHNNCRLYLEYLQSEKNTDRASSSYHWRYLRCLLGTGQEEAALAQLAYLQDSNIECNFEVAMDVFDLAWQMDSEKLRQQTALFAARLFLKQRNALALDRQKSLLSLNENLLREEEPQNWIALFRENGLESAATFLMCYFRFGIGADPDSIQAAADKLFALLNDGQEQTELSTLTAVTKFALDNGLLTDSDRRDTLLSVWLDAVLSTDPENGLLCLETLTDVEYSVLWNFWKNVELTAAQKEAVRNACFRTPYKRTGNFFRRILTILGRLDREDLQELTEAFVSWFAELSEEDTSAVKVMVYFFENVPLEHSQMRAFLNSAADQDLLYAPAVRKALFAKCDELWPDLQYAYLQALYFRSEPETQEEVLQQAQTLLSNRPLDITPDNDALRFAYSIVCADPTPDNLQFLQKLYHKAEKTEYVEILRQIIAANRDDADAEALRQWFFQIMEDRSEEWLDFYSKWWAPLIRLREEDHQAKGIVAYLTDDDDSQRYKDSVLRLLLSNLYFPGYIACYRRLEKELSETAAAKLTYFRALRDPAFCADAIRECIEMHQYLYAVKLLTTQIKPIPANAVFIGKTAGDIYTQVAMVRCPELADFVPEVFRHIIRLNQADPAGAWKNVGRAVDIAILTGKEGVFLDIFNEEYQNMYYNYASKCAVLIANLILRGDFAEASHYLQEHKERKNNDPYLYMELLNVVIGDCVGTGVLSEENDILVRSIPINGNMRSLELYGNLVHYAIEKQRVRPCAKAFFALRKYAPQDKALLACCIQLYSVLANELPLRELYDVAKHYLRVVQDSLILRTGKVMAVITACAGEELDGGQLLDDCRSRIQDGEDLSEIKHLERECARFLEGAVGLAERRLTLIRAATGWWHIDAEVVCYANTAGSLFEKLTELYPSAFYSACTAGALRAREDAPLFDAILDLVGDYNWCREQIVAAVQYPDALCKSIVDMMDCPMDLPGLYNRNLEQTLTEPNGKLFQLKMNLLLAVQRNFTVTQFDENLYGLKEMSEACPSDRQYELFRLLLKKSTLASNTLLRPDQYVDAAEYGMAVISAEKQLERQDLTPFFVTLNTVYLELGKFMTERTSRKYKLHQLLNMATLLCQSKSYGDLQQLLDVCPAKWKLCLRTVQELIQGDPRNVLYLMRNADFREHDGCYMFVYAAVQKYLESTDWINAVKRERERKRRDNNWGVIHLNTVERPVSTRIDVFLLRGKIRNPAPIGSYREFVDANIALMKQEDASKAQKASADREAAPESEELSLAGTAVDQGEEIWKLPFVADCLAQYQSEESRDEEDYSGREAEKKRLRQALDISHSHTETVELCGKLLSLMRQEPVTNITKETCISLALALFCEKQEHTGMASRVTEEARTVLYSMAPCFKGIPSARRYGNTLKIYVRECLESYQDLALFTADCMGEGLMALCDIISRSDKDAAKYLRKHIQFAQNIGKKMREPMTNTDRLAWLQGCITECRAGTEHPIEVGAKEALVNMLNQEIRVFRNKAQTYLCVYNTESTVENGWLFGKVENLGRENISKLVLSLSVDGIFKAQYTLPALRGGEMVPFSLLCSKAEEPGTLTYKLSMKYTTMDGTEETATPVEGELTLVVPGPEKHRFQRYDASNPADSENYVERASISTTLEANYLVDGGFRRFPNFAIYGMKRSGKSSVLRRLGRLFDEHYPDDVRHVIVSCEGITDDFYTRAHAVFVKYVLDELNFKFDMESKDGWQEFCEKWETLPEFYEDFRWVDSFYVALTRQWLPNVGLVILIDEIERLYFELGDQIYLSESQENSTPASVDSSHAQSVLWDVINKMTQREGSMVRFVLCGSDFFTSKIIAEGDNLTQFFQKGVKLNVDRMEYEEIRAALCANHSISLHEDTVNYLWDIAAGLPWHSKIFCNSVIENLLIRRESNTRAMIYPSDIQDAIDLILSTTKNIASPANFGLLSLNDEERLLVKLVAEALDSRMAKIGYEDLMERVSLADKDAAGSELYAKALRSLVNDRKLLRLDKSKNYQLGCELYRLYLRHEVPARFL